MGPESLRSGVSGEEGRVVRVRGIIANLNSSKPQIYVSITGFNVEKNVLVRWLENF